MADDRDTGAMPEPKSSADLIREAREAVAGGGDSTTSSEDIMSQARSWLESEDAGTAEEVSLISSEEPAEEPYLDDLELHFEPPAPRRPRPRRQPPSRVPPRTPSPEVPQIPMPRQRSPEEIERTARAKRRISAVVGGLIALALVGNLAGFLASNATNDDDAANISGTPVSDTSSASITSGSDPCTGAALSGGLELVATYVPGTASSELSVLVSGSLATADGRTYELDGFGNTLGAPDQTEFVVRSVTMSMVRDDGAVAEDDATITVVFENGVISDWSYQSQGAVCRG